MTRLRVATWNVHEGITAGHAAPRDGEAFWAPLIAARVDVAALQEVRFSTSGDLGDLELVAKRAGLPHIAAFPLSVSLFDSEASAGVALLSRRPLCKKRPRKLPNPGLRREGNGSVLDSHDKGLLEAVFDHDGQPVRMISLHALPFHRFGRVPQDFESIWTALAELIEPVTEVPLLIAGDFNTNHRELLTDRVQGKLHSAIGQQITHENRATDDILYTDMFRLISQDVVPTYSDHALCLAELELPHVGSCRGFPSPAALGRNARRH
jgi:endonuclease/exonuclease/phosphatase family metal-dependent hydrolase